MVLEMEVRNGESTIIAIGRFTKKAIIGAFKSTGEKAQSIVVTTADMVQVTLKTIP
jgi:hypothetical protein